jgi:hypothetical protein
MAHDVKVTRLSELYGDSWTTRANLYEETPDIDFAFSSKFRLFPARDIEDMAAAVDGNMSALLQSER